MQRTQYSKLLSALCAALLLTLCTTTARAQFDFTLTGSSLLTTAAPNTFRFFGTINYTGTVNNITLNDLAFDLGGAPITTNTNVFFANVPGVFSSGDPAYSGPLFDVSINSGAPSGTYSGTVQLLGDPSGGGDPNVFLPLLQNPVPFQVTTTPEPGSLSLIALGGIALALGRFIRVSTRATTRR